MIAPIDPWPAAGQGRRLLQRPLDDLFETARAQGRRMIAPHCSHLEKASGPCPQIWVYYEGEFAGLWMIPEHYCARCVRQLAVTPFERAIKHVLAEAKADAFDASVLQVVEQAKWYLGWIYIDDPDPEREAALPKAFQ